MRKPKRRVVGYETTKRWSTRRRIAYARKQILSGRRHVLPMSMVVFPGCEQPYLGGRPTRFGKRRMAALTPAHPVWFTDVGDPVAKYVFTVLAVHENEKSLSFPSIARICEITGYARRTVNAALNHLEKNGRIRRTKVPRSSGGFRNEYALTFDPQGRSDPMRRAGDAPRIGHLVPKHRAGDAPEVRSTEGKKNLKGGEAPLWFCLKCRKNHPTKGPSPCPEVSLTLGHSRVYR